MPETRKPLRIAGTPIAAPDPKRPFVRAAFHDLKEKTAVRVAAARETGGEVQLHDVDDRDLVELQLADGGVLITSVGRLRELTAEGAVVRGGESDLLTDYLPFVSNERGIGAVVLRVVRFFAADPVPAIADHATRDAIAHIEGQLAEPPGLYVVDDQGRLKDRVEERLAGGEPRLVLIHGTASSTIGGFSGLLGTDEWRELRREYGKDRIYAFEHRTLSESPVQNALALLRLLPPKSEIHLLTHSRGGLVGELLCRGPFEADALRAFRNAGNRPFTEQAELLELGALLRERAPRIERFVRVACPAAGTILASGRLDLYLSLLRNAFALGLPDGVDAAVDALTAVVIEVARRRADPAELPGLEAQRPESPLIHFLNYPGGPGVDQDLRVVAGDLQAGSIRQTLRAVAAYTFFLQKNDLVVDTKAMYGGVPRSRKAWASYHEGTAVSHFSYFREEATRKFVVGGLLHRGKRDEKPEGWKELADSRDTDLRFTFGFGRRTRDGKVSQEFAPVLVLPDVFATELRAADGSVVWPDVARLAQGLRSLDATADGLAPGDVLRASAPCEDSRPLTALERALAGVGTVKPVPYDWRLGVEDAANRLATAVTNAKQQRAPIHLVGHGLGALGILHWATRPQTDAADVAAIGRVVLLAPPLDGAAAILRLCIGRSPLFDMLRFIDGSGTASDLVRLFLGMPGILELLPTPALEASWWERLAGTMPPKPLLDAVRRRRQALAAALDGNPLRERVAMVFGAADVTLTFELDRDDDLVATRSAKGDGWMLDPDPADRDDERTRFVPVVHEALLWHSIAVQLVADLLTGRRGSAGNPSPPDQRATRTEVEAVRLPSQAELEAALLIGGRMPTTITRVLRVGVAHGSVDRLDLPVAIGHYSGDSINGAEKFLDRRLNGRLSRLLAAGLALYPGPTGTGKFVTATGLRPNGALVVGLGEIGEVNGDTITRGVAAAVVDYGLEEWHRHVTQGTAAPSPVDDQPAADDLQLRLASLLIGTRGGRQLSVRRSIVAITNGVLHANRVLADVTKGAVAVGELIFAELWTDVAIQAGHVVAQLATDTGVDLLPEERLEPEGRLRLLDGRRGNSREASDWSWWRRIIVTEQAADGAAPRRLLFTTLTESARADDAHVLSDQQTVEDMLAKAPSPSNEVQPLATSNALYEQLLPVAVKENLYDGTELVLVVDQESGRYPWELLARRRGTDLEPLVRKVRVIRQFRTGDFRDVKLTSTLTRALVIGNPKDAPPLPGASQESAEVAAMLKARGYDVTLSRDEDSATILQKFFLDEYRIMHIAAHGEYVAKDPERSGVIVGPPEYVPNVPRPKPRTLTAATFRQLRRIPELVFLNCCHLGRLDSPKDGGGMAASLSETLLKLGVRAVVVTGWAVNDRAAKLFAETFYDRLFAGKTFGESVHAARRAVLNEFLESSTWGAYQCYGDPTFTLAASSAPPPPPPEFVSASEACEEVTDVHAAATSYGNDKEDVRKLRERLESIERRLPPEWQDDGALLNARALAWATLGMEHRAKAIELYHRAVIAQDAHAPIRAAEQLANLVDRFSSDVLDAQRGPGFAGSPLERDSQEILQLFDRLGANGDRATPIEEVAADRLQAVAQLAETAERWGLLAGHFRRTALAATDGRGDDLLRRALESYEHGLALAERRTGRIPYYPGIPAIGVAALAWKARGISAEQRTTLDKWVAGCRASAELEHAQRGRTFWNAAVPLDLRLLMSLIEGEFDYARSDGLTRDYRDLLREGTAQERDSVTKHIAQLAQLAARLGLQHEQTFLERIQHGIAPRQ